VSQQTALLDKRVVGTSPGGGYRVLIASVDETTSPLTIRYETLPVLSWVTVEYRYRQPAESDDRHPYLNPYISAEPLVIDEASGTGIELPLAVPGIDLYAVSRILPPGVTTLSQAESQEMEEDLAAVYREHRRKVKKLRAERDERAKKIAAFESPKSEQVVN
jgi:hypothetical protein